MKTNAFMSACSEKGEKYCTAVANAKLVKKLAQSLSAFFFYCALVLFFNNFIKTNKINFIASSVFVGRVSLERRKERINKVTKCIMIKVERKENIYLDWNKNEGKKMKKDWKNENKENVRRKEKSWIRRKIIFRKSKKERIWIKVRITVKNERWRK